MFAKIKSVARLAFTPEWYKSTGLESLSTAELVRLVEEKDAFSQNAVPGTSLLWAPWSEMLDIKFLKRPSMQPFVAAMREQLADKPLLELGVGKNFDNHRNLCKKFFGVSEYRACDVQSLYPEAKQGFLVKNLLLALEEGYVEGMNVMAFGVFNEPLDITSGFMLPARSAKAAHAGHVEYEYTKRLIAALRRVVFGGGIVFGDGIHPLGRDYLVERLELRSVGFDMAMLERLVDGYSAINECDRPDIRDPFILTIGEEPRR
jgi:hypothetical protein